MILRRITAFLFALALAFAPLPAAAFTQVPLAAPMPPESLSFNIAAVAATTTTQWGLQLTTKPLVIQNITLAVGAFTCGANPTLALRDCSAVLGTCTPVATLGTSAAISAIGYQTITISQANVAAGEYLAVQFTAGTCTVLNAQVSVIATPQS